MKTLRTVPLLVIAVLVFSAWMPSPAFARSAEAATAIVSGGPNQTAEVVTTKVVPLTVKNRTGGVLFITLEGPKTYYFTIPDAKAKFLIIPGRYRVRAISTGCSGTFEQKKYFKDGGNLVYYCDSQ
jgi:hypothetical protein